MVNTGLPRPHLPLSLPTTRLEPRSRFTSGQAAKSSLITGHGPTHGTCRPALSPTHTDHAPTLSIRPSATHLTSPTLSRATATPPIAWTHATPCADRPHQCSLPSSRPVVCRTALPLLPDANLTPWRVRPPSLSIHPPAACPIRATRPLYVPPTVHATLHADLLPAPFYVPRHRHRHRF